MPTYDYFCEANGQVIEVSHRMSERMETWQELCDRAGIEPGDTAGEARVQRLISGGNVVHSSSLGSGSPRPCDRGVPCRGGSCSFD